MKFLKLALILIFANALSLSAFADSDMASDEAKLALLMGDSLRLQSIGISASDAAIKSEVTINGDESSTTTVQIKIQGELKTYVVTKDGGGQVVSVVRTK
jgi:hypothetical protein